MVRTPSSRPFATPKSRNLKSSHPRTIQNREYRLAKRGIELSELRDDGAFRTSKSRALKKLRTSDSWVDMSAAEQRKAEEEVVRQLEEKRDAKKRAHEMEWFHKVENDEIASDEDDKGVETKEVEEGEEGEEGDAGEKDEWLTEDDEDSESEKWKGDSMEFVNSIIEVQRKSGYAFIKGLRKAEESAVKKAEERNVK
jgi:ribonuclease D